MKQASIDEFGHITGFYSPDVNDDIPEGTIPITDPEWQYHLSGNRLMWDGSAWVEVITPLPEYRESAQNQVDADCKAYIYEYWSAEAQSNVAMGLYEEALCNLCKDEISTVLSDNKTHIDTIETLGTEEEIDTYLESIVRPIITGGRS